VKKTLEEKIRFAIPEESKLVIVDEFYSSGLKGRIAGYDYDKKELIINSNYLNDEENPIIKEKILRAQQLNSYNPVRLRRKTFESANITEDRKGLYVFKENKELFNIVLEKETYFQSIPFEKNLSDEEKEKLILHYIEESVWRTTFLNHSPEIKEKDYLLKELSIRGKIAASVSASFYTARALAGIVNYFHEINSESDARKAINEIKSNLDNYLNKLFEITYLKRNEEETIREFVYKSLE
jgi:hypothetical protein